MSGMTVALWLLDYAMPIALRLAAAFTYYVLVGLTWQSFTAYVVVVFVLEFVRGWERGIGRG